MDMPKEGSIDRIILDKLMASPGGATYLDFDPALGITAEIMDGAIIRLTHGIYESESDDQIKFDS